MLVVLRIRFAPHRTERKRDSLGEVSTVDPTVGIIASYHYATL